jgi:hypothetical protein
VRERLAAPGLGLRAGLFARPEGARKGAAARDRGPCPRDLTYDVRPEKPTRVWLQGKVGALTPGQALVLLPLQEGESSDSPVAYRAPLRQALIDDNTGHVNLVVCKTDFKALKRGLAYLPPPMQ